MKCPTCGFDNIPGSDECEGCESTLMNLDGIEINVKTKLERIILREPLRQLPRREAVCVPPDATIHDVVLKMNAMRSGSVLIEDDGDIVGILTERDILFRMSDDLKYLDKIRVRDWMKSPVEGLEEKDTLAYALNQMSVKRYRHIPIFKADEKPRMVSARDLLQHLCQFL